ncbi:hypothetical protein [Nocardioides sp. Soil805]|uniref:hypothetical protein n=1 Tax=Nocardioides sp. Soil805 TaxID=1736416 RepID=UPI000702E212|nr:hypothetical protein [Nocardioides sp. Soil805]KRF35043.1 hypothetical protein ASG94_12995 [Nocardioides sp. Soil805]
MRVRRGELLDALVADGRAAVFVRGQVVVLSEMATVILTATPVTGSTTLEQLTATVVDEFGPPAPPLDALELTRAQVVELVEHHVLDAG